MKTKIKLSKLLQIGLLLTFFLPFFSGCEKKSASAPTTDSTLIAVDSLRKDSVLSTTPIEIKDTIKTITSENKTQNADKTGEEDEELSTRMSHKSVLLQYLLRPNNNYTGIASLIDCFSLLEIGYGLGIAFILWLIALVVKIKDFNNIFVLLNIIGLLFMYGTHSMYNIMSEKRLWGFWVCMIWSMSMIIYDCIILLRFKREKQRATSANSKI